MLEFLQKYWLETLMVSTTSAIGFFLKKLWSRLKKEVEEQKIIKQAVLTILHNTLYQTCQFYIMKGYILVSELNNVEHLYKSYHKLGGNGTGTELYMRCRALPVKTPQELYENAEAEKQPQ